MCRNLIFFSFELLDKNSIAKGGFIGKKNCYMFGRILFSEPEKDTTKTEWINALQAADEGARQVRQMWVWNWKVMVLMMINILVLDVWPVNASLIREGKIFWADTTCRVFVRIGWLD